MDSISVPVTLAGVAGRLLLATACGAAVGLNRERQGKPAGLRTHALVALGGALFTIIGLLLRSEDVAASGRILQGITAGIGFIGAGVIMHRQDAKVVHGLTTAAAMWVVTAVGVAVGAGLWRISLVGLGLTLVVLIAGEFVDHWLHRDMPPGF
jgi:putative Mg2+ transporter-C (MgtC) family protein